MIEWYKQVINSDAVSMLWSDLNHDEVLADTDEKYALDSFSNCFFL